MQESCNGLGLDVQARNGSCLMPSGVPNCSLTWGLAIAQTIFAVVDILVSLVNSFEGKVFSEGSMKWYVAAPPAVSCCLSTMWDVSKPCIVPDLLSARKLSEGSALDAWACLTLHECVGVI